MKCYIDDKECEYYDGDECLAIFPEQCRIHNITDEELKEQAEIEVK